MTVSSSVSPRALFRAAALAEAVTWALLIGGMLARAAGLGGLGVTIGGALHGFVFLAFGATALLVGTNQRWGGIRMLLALAAAVVPFATVPLELVYDRQGALAGGWRREAGADPRDARLPSRALFLLLRRPRALAAGAGTAVAAVFAALLLVE